MPTIKILASATVLLAILCSPKAIASDLSCLYQEPKNAIMKYDRHGRLIEIEDRGSHTRARFYYDKVKITVEQQARLDRVAVSASGKPLERWVDLRDVAYDSRSGKLASVLVHDDETNLSRNFYIPSDHDFSSDATRNGSTLYLGRSYVENIQYERLSQNDHDSILIPEPTNILEEDCFAFGGQSFRLHRNLKAKSFSSRVITGMRALTGEVTFAGQVENKATDTSSHWEVKKIQAPASHNNSSPSDYTDFMTAVY